MIKRIILFLILISLATSKLLSFNLKDYALPAHLKAVLDAHQGDLPESCKLAGTSYHIKINSLNFGQTRLQGLDNGKRTTAQYPQRISLIKFPIKYSYSAKGRNYVIAQRIEKGNEKLNLKQIQQLADFTMKSGWSNAYQDNFIIGKDGCVYIIDTKGIEHKKAIKAKLAQHKDVDLLGWFESEFEKNIGFRSRGSEGLGNILIALRQSGLKDDIDQKIINYLEDRWGYENARIAVDEWTLEKLAQVFEKEIKQDLVNRDEQKQQQEIVQKVRLIEDLMDYR